MKASISAGVGGRPVNIHREDDEGRPDAQPRFEGWVPQTTLWWVLALVALASAAYLQRLPRVLPAAGKRVTNRADFRIDGAVSGRS